MRSGPAETAGPDPAVRRLEAEVAITQHTAVATGAGFIPVPLADFVVIAAAQLSLLYRLCRIYRVPFSPEAARSVVASLVGAAVPSGVAPLLLASSLKAIPGIGTAFGSVATPALAAGVTYAVGRVFVTHLESGGTLLDFSADGMRAHFEKALDERAKGPVR
jgi:uncharacterized protein (DUF697 family)